MMKMNRNWLCLASAALLVASITACDRSANAPIPTAETATTASAGSVTKPVTYKLVNAALAKEVSASGEINALTNFAPDDNVIGVAILEGSEGKPAIKVEIISSSGVVISSGEASEAINIKSAVQVPLKFSSPVEEGAYSAKFYVDNVPSWEVPFTIRK